MTDVNQGYVPPAGQGPPAPWPGRPANEQKNNLGVFAIVLGGLSFVACGLFTGIPAIIVGRASQQAEAQGLATNGMLGKVGFIVGIIGTALWALLAAAYIVPLVLSFAVIAPFLLAGGV